MMEVAKGSVGKLLQCLPQETIKYAFAYGSGAFKQTGDTTTDKMVDFIVATNDPVKFHLENIKQNPKHYSSVRFLGAHIVSQLQQKYAARVYYNTRVRHRVYLLATFAFRVIIVLH